MHARPATSDDVPALAALQVRWDTYWLGAPENDESEVRSTFDRVDRLAERSRVLLDDGGQLLGASWWQGTDTQLLADPGADPAALYDDLLPWLRSSGARAVDALSTDVALADALTRHGWQYERSAFDLLRAVGDDWRLARPQWPDGVRVSDLAATDERAVHDLIYREAGWALVPGHGQRDLDEWRSLFVNADHPADQQVLAWDGDRLVGVALGRTFSDGSGWVAQLAVRQDQRRRGLGRALLLESMRRRVAAGATQLGLSVSATNHDALRLYLSVGLRIDREWRNYRPA